MMRVAQFRPYDIANGYGIRCSLFVAGCSHNCPGCFNQAYRDFSYGELWSDNIENQVLTQLMKDEIQGLTLLGGEPMDHAKDLTEILLRLRKQLYEKGLNKDIWIYSGYTLEQILADETKKSLLLLCDVLIDGLFEIDKKSPDLPFRGSANQRLIVLSEVFEKDNS